MRLVLILGIVLLPLVGWAQNRLGLDTSLANQLGSAAGAAYACNAGKSLEDFEVIASRLLANSAETAEDERSLDEAYVEAKIRAMKLHKKEHPMSCQEILKRFQDMRIFKFIVYADGSVKKDDGTMLYPKRPVKKISQNKKK
ncbi:MAG: hypothetical protein J6Y85_01365 [Alphaproteobacteria bacterium]|nr:hypothetical protein [Alphaproteobacteria bacterium]